MSETVFTKVDYDLNSLVNYIALGEIGLPDIQRPFVWNNAKVRDLFDSMYKGYPVGYLLFWQNAFAESSRTIGTDTKQKPPRLVIVDGQQRLTSLYAVIWKSLISINMPPSAYCGSAGLNLTHPLATTSLVSAASTRSSQLKHEIKT
jgi:uncharacterized protein with ParB-like and HNH nuclease domain